MSENQIISKNKHYKYPDNIRDASRVINQWRHPSKQETVTQIWFNVGSASRESSPALEWHNYVNLQLQMTKNILFEKK